MFSPDGTRLAFVRATTVGGSPADEVVVADADGSRPIVLTSSVHKGGYIRLDWAPDSRTILALAGEASDLWLIDATQVDRPPRVVAHDADTFLRPFQPPKGAGLLIRRDLPDGQHAIVLLDLATGRSASSRPTAAATTWARRAGRPTGHRSCTTTRPRTTRTRSGCSS